MSYPIGSTVFPTELFALDGETKTIQSVIDQLTHLGLKWQVEDDPANGRKRALAPLYVNRGTGEIWAVATVENWGSPRHRHNPGGVYGELVLTLAGSLDDVTDSGHPVKCVPGTAIFHAGNTIHQATGEFWAGIYHQPYGSTPAPLDQAADVDRPSTDSRQDSGHSGNETMAQWVFLLTAKESYPDPEFEIDQLITLAKEGIVPHLLLSNQPAPPGKSALPGDYILLCSGRRGRNVARARACVIRPAQLLPTSPAGLENLYKADGPRYWLEVSIDKFQQPKTEEDLGLPSDYLQSRGGRWFVKRI